MPGPYSRFISDISKGFGSDAGPNSRFIKLTLPHSLHFSRAIRTRPKCVVDNSYNSRNHLHPFVSIHLSIVSVFGYFWHVLDGQEDCRCRMLILGQGLLPLHQRPTPTMPGALFFFTRTESIWRLNCWTGSKTIEKMTGSPSGVATFIPVLSTCESIGSCKQRTEEGIKTSLESNHWWWTLLNVAPGCICHPLHYFR